MEQRLDDLLRILAAFFGLGLLGARILSLPSDQALRAILVIGLVVGIPLLARHLGDNDDDDQGGGHLAPSLRAAPVPVATPLG